MGDEVKGLFDSDTGEWPRIEVGPDEAVIEKLRPGSPLHDRVLKHLLELLRMSEQEMSKFHARWRASEKRAQAYIDLKDWEKEVKRMNDSGEAPKVVSVQIPYTFATISAVTTYLIHTFAGRRPMFQVGSYKKETIEAARNMERVLQYNADHTRLTRHMFQHFYDGELYGVGVFRTLWKEETGVRTVWRENQVPGFLGLFSQSQKVQIREERTIYSGNEVVTQDPFLFFPDPRVPLTEVNTKGQFVFWRDFVGRHMLLRDKTYRWVNSAGDMPANVYGENMSARALLSGGTATPGHDASGKGFRTKNFVQIDQGTVDIIPKELGLGDSEEVERWLFTIANKKQIIQAERFDTDHGKHPVSVVEPYGMGYGFGNLGLADYLGPTQDTLGWLVNSHIANVRTALNNMWIVDPEMVNVKDLKNPEPGKIIRLKPSAVGQDVRAALQQLPVSDVTRNHLQDFELMMRMGDSLSAITDNLRGLQHSGGRKTATEVRTSGEAAASRLAALAKRYSSQSIVDLTEQMVLNNQQFLTEEFYIDVVGEAGQEAPVRISPEMVVGDFYFPVHDGTLPLDRVALLDVWKEIFIAVSQDQELRNTFSVTKIFEHIAELGGARNIDAFKLNLGVADDEAVDKQVQAGNMVPISEAQQAL